LPAALREQINTPEQAVAFLTINDMPRGSAEVRKSKALDNWPAPTELIDVFLTGEDERRKDVQLVFTNQNGAWKLVVMEGVIAKYTNQLKEGVSASAALPRANP